MIKLKFSFGTVVAVLLVICSLYSKSSFAGKSSDGTKHDLGKARVMDRVILAVLEDYYDSTRMIPVKMFKAALDKVEKNVAEVMVSYSDKVATITVFNSNIKIPFDQVGSPWGLSLAFHRIFKFIAAKLPKNPPPNYRQIEYAAVNGLLSTLDPHTSAMTPELWDELRMSTQGAFEGIGIRITTDYRKPCNGDLTVVEVFDGSPAKKSGLKTGDKIIKIGDDSTVNITTGEAADQLRGRHGTTVKVTVKRVDGSVKTVDIVRQRIPIESVTFKMLKDKVGYIKLEAFQQSSAKEMEDALESLHEDGMKGLLLDLRSNPGGLLSSAIEIADLFISNGSIVTTAGRNKDDRDVSNATNDGTEPDYPIAVLIDAYSASAAEILSGALRNHGRAILVGDTSFGKGSVQNIISLPDGGAMRMTIQQYLIPGDMSIQAVGVSPDIFFKPRLVDKKELIISDKERMFSEATLDAHLTRASKIERADRPGALQMPYFVPSNIRKKDMDMLKTCYQKNPDTKPYRNQYQVDFARELIASAKGVTAVELLLSAKTLVESRTDKENIRLSKALKKMKVDWSIPDAKAAAAKKMIVNDALKASIGVTGKLVAGKKFYLTVTVKNSTKQTVYRLRAKTKSDNPYLTGLEMVFGKIAPGKSAKWKTEVELPPIISARIDPVDISFFSFDGTVPKKISTVVDIKGRVNPRLVYRWWLKDLGNGNGFMEPGERFKMYLDVKNEGLGRTFKTAVNLSALGIDVESGHFVMKPLAKGQSDKGEFVFKIPAKINKKTLDVNLAFEEWVPLKIPALIMLQSQKITMDIKKRAPVAEDASGTVTAQSKTPLFIYDAPDKSSRVMAFCNNGDAFTVKARIGKYFKVEDKDGEQGWIVAAKTVPGGKPVSVFNKKWARLPEIMINEPVASTVKSDKFNISGTVSHPGGLRDMFIFADGKKVIYHPLKNGTDSYKFSFKVALKKGANKISVVARHDSLVLSSKNIFVRRMD